MLRSKAFIYTLRNIPQEADSLSHQLMVRASLVRMLISGVYIYLPLGLKVLRNIERVIREEMNACGAEEVLLPALQPLELWQKTGRDEAMGEVMFRFIDRKGRKLCLGPTHEEVITFLVKNYVSSYRQLPFTLYQIQTKFRDEIRPRFGLVRSCEFIMKDAYSFDKDEKGLERSYQKMFFAYKRIFKRCGLNFYIVQADPGVMGGDVSHEFMVPAESGEDAILRCLDCGYVQIFKENNSPVNCPKCATNLEKINTLEIGHIFKLKTKYSLSFDAYFLDKDGKQKPIIMGCYGIGVSRLISAIIEQNHDTDGIIWPKEISPYKVIIIPLNVKDRKISQMAKELYKKLSDLGIETVLDDRDEQAGVKFKDADLLGIYLQVVIGKEWLTKKNIELRFRKNKKVLKLKENQLLNNIKKIIDG